MKRGPEYGHRNKEVVRAASKKANRSMIWLDPDGRWHGAMGEENVPKWAKESEKTCRDK